MIKISIILWCSLEIPMCYVVAHDWIFELYVEGEFGVLAYAFMCEDLA